MVGELGQVRPDDVTILDTEASIEHMTRGTVRTADAILLVTEPYYRSLETTGRLAALARELGTPHVWAVANKVRTPSDEVAVREFCDRHQIDVLAVVPFDERVTEADRQGRALIDHDPNAPVVRAVSELADALERRWAAAGAG